MKPNKFIEPTHHQSYYQSNNKIADYIVDGGVGCKGTVLQKRLFRLLPASQPIKYKICYVLIAIKRYKLNAF